MKKMLFIGMVLFLFKVNTKGQTTLQTVTTAGNTTDHALFINGDINYNVGNYNGLLLYFRNGAGYIDALNPGNSSSLPLLLRGSSIQTNSKLLVNNATDDGSTALQVAGGIKTTGAGYRAISANITSGYGTIDLNYNGARRAFMGFNTASPDNGYASFGAVDDAGVERGLYIQRSNGNVGVGITTPTRKMDIRSSTSDGLRIGTGDNQYVGELTWNTGVVQLAAAGYGSPDLTLSTGGAERLRIKNEGNIGIGTASPSEKLSVNGNIRCRKLIVTQTGWADYVFDSAYTLQPLAAIEKYINKEKRLPGMPGAVEIAKDGLEVGEMMRLQQAKIEELTLYLIQLKKDNEQLMSRVQQLESANKGK